MAIPFTDFSKAPIQDSPLKDLFENAFKGYSMSQIPGKLADEKKQRELANSLAQLDLEHKPKQYELDDRHKSLANAMQELANKHLPKQYQMGDELTQAKINQANATSSKAQMLQKVFSNLMNGNQPGANGNQNAPKEDFDKTSQTSYAQAAIASKAMGIEPKIVNIDGVQTAITPFGNYPIAKGQSPLQKELTKQDAKTIAGFENTAASGIAAKPTMDELSRITSSPIFEEMRQSSLAPGYEMSYYLRAGNPEQKELAGNFMTYTNQLIKDSSRDFAGQFRVGEQEMLERMKLSPKDTLDVARGKLESLMLMRDLMTKRASIASDLARNQGMSPLKALETADKQLDLNKMREEIRQKVGIKKTLPQSMQKKGYTMEDIEHTAKKRHMTVQEVISQWEKSHG